MPIINNINNLNRLVTPAEVITNAFNTSGNLDTYLLSPQLIKIAEITHIEPNISREFYEELVNEHHTASLSTPNLLLMSDYLQNCLSWYVKLEVMNDLAHQATSSGLVDLTDDYSESSDSAAFAQMKNDVERKAGLFMTDMLDFLNASNNVASYPTFHNNTKGSQELGSEGTNKRMGIIFH